MSVAAVAEPLTITVSALLDAGAVTEWDDFVMQHPRASLYHTARWVDFAGDVFRFERRYWLARDAANRLVGVLPLVRQTSLFFGTRWVSLPFFNYGGPLGDSPAIEESMIRGAAAAAHGARGTTLEIRDTVPGRSMSCRRGKVTMLRELPESPELLGKQLGSKIRSQVRRADREGPTVHVGGSDLVEEFYAVFAEAMRDLGTPVYPAAFFRKLLGDLGQDCTVVIVRLQGRPAAAALLTHFRDVTEVPWAATRRSFRATSVNMRLYWECLSLAIRRRSTHFDFGRSTKDSGTYAFKAQWGAAPKALYWYYPLSPRDAAAGGDSRLVRTLQQSWMHLPLRIANLVGPCISPGLPW
jgi:serine/alanine adding enzyme